MQILGDKDRLVKRSQLKRSVYRVLGTAPKQEQSEIIPTEQVSTSIDQCFLGVCGRSKRKWWCFEASFTVDTITQHMTCEVGFLPRKMQCFRGL